jgi:hypothetical protein
MKQICRKYVITSLNITSCGLTGDNISEEPAASIFREAILVYIYQTTWHHISEGSDLDIHRREILEYISH